MSLRDEFKAFILRGNVVDLAIAVVIGGAFGAIVKAFVDGMVNPLVNLVLPSKGSLDTFVVGPFKIGHVLGETINFLVIFLVLVKGLAALSNLKKKEEAPAEAPKTKECPECLSEIPVAAKRCRHCTSAQI